MDPNSHIRKELYKLLEKLTHSGDPSLHQGLMKQVKTLCRQSDSHLRLTYELIMKILAKEHAQVRLSAFQVISELFSRSNQFRELVTSEFKKFAGLVTGTDPSKPLPPPKDAAAQLKKSSLLAIKEWNQKFGSGYPELKLGFNYLKFNRKVDFDKLVAEGEADRRRRDEKESRQRNILQQRVGEVMQEMEDLKRELDVCLTEMESCFNLLLPRFDIPDIYKTDIPSLPSYTTTSEYQLPPKRQRVAVSTSSCSFASLSECTSDEEDKDEEREKQDNAKEKVNEITTAENEVHTCKQHFLEDIYSEDKIKGSRDLSDSDSDVEWEDVVPASSQNEEPMGVVMQEHGLALRGLVIPVRLGARVEIRETEDNTSVLSSLRENRQLLVTHFLPTLNKCLEWMTKAGDETKVKAGLDIKTRIDASLAKYNRLDIAYTLPLPEAAPPSPVIKMKPKLSLTQSAEWTFGSEVQEPGSVTSMELDPTTPRAQIEKLKKKMKMKSVRIESNPLLSSCLSESASSKQSDLKNRAPVVPFGMDLYHWENPANSVEPRMLAPIGSLHRFWAEEKEVSITEDERNRLKCRTISFPGQFSRVSKSCRVPLPSGKLCPRQDRYKCPFHGVIIPRDDDGNPVPADGGQGRKETDELAISSSSQEQTLWQEKDLVMAATAIHIPGEKKKKGRRKAAPKHPGLADLSAKTDTPRERLKKKVFSKRSLKRVTMDVDKQATKKYTDKYADSFHYALKN